MLDPALDHAVLLEREGRQLDLHRLPLAHEADVLVRHPHLGAQRFLARHQRQQHRARLHDSADGMRGEVFDDAVVRRLQFQQLLLVRLLGAFLGELVDGVLRIAALGMELAPVVGIDLRQLLLGLQDGGPRRLDHELLGLEFLLLLDTLAPLVAGHEAAGVAVLDELLEGGILLLVVRQGFHELGLHLLGRRKIVPRLHEAAFLLGQGRVERGAIGAVLRLDFARQSDRNLGIGTK